MGQEVPERYLQLLNNFPNDRRHPEACDDMPYGLPSSLTSEVGNTPVDIYIATEEATGSASAEVVEELSTRSKLELQAVQIITENPWHLFQSGIMTLRNNKGERITNVFGEAVLIVRVCTICYQHLSKKIFVLRELLATSGKGIHFQVMLFCSALVHGR